MTSYFNSNKNQIPHFPRKLSVNIFNKRGLLIMQFIAPKSPVKFLLFIVLFILANSSVSNAQQKKPTAVKKNQTAAKDVRNKIPPDKSVDDNKKPETSFRTETIRNIAADNFEGEDLQIRRAAVNALGDRAGTVVVMEVKTGKILTIVNQDWGIRQSFKPCSTIKLVTGIAGANENLIDENGRVRNQATRFNLDDSLAFSDNGYFQQIGKNLGNRKMIEYARELGLGQKTGINADGESAGRLPYGNENLRIYSHGDDFEVTPLQLAVMVSAINNDGKIVVPRVPSTEIENANFRGFLRRGVELSGESIQSVIPGMRGSAKYGTSRVGTNPAFRIAGKTGSCIEHNSWVGLFASVAPLEAPKYAVVVITRGQNERGKYAAMVAGQIYEALRPRLFINDAPILLANYNDNKNPVIVGKNTSPVQNENAADSKINPENNKKSEPTETTFSSVVIEYEKESETSEPVNNSPQITRPRIVKID